MANDLTPLNETDSKFIDLLLENDGNVAATTRAMGICAPYGYVLKKKLARHIAEAAQNYLAAHAVKAAKKVVDTMDETMPNPVQLQAANSILDRTGVKYVEEEKVIVVKPNIFILPEKRPIQEVIDTDYERA